MRVLSSKAAMRRASAEVDGKLVLVPTMGALHDGHLALIRRARALAGDDGAVVVSIYVNPTQFGPAEDLERYPRPWAADRRKCRDAGVDIVFRPEASGLYEPDHSTWVDEAQLSSGLCGASRPGHFRGVCTVVAKLLMIVQPDTAVFGEKDYQQLAIVRRMVRDLDLPVRIVGVPTIREADGLAMSSRNAYLSDEDRARAVCLRRGLLAARQAWRDGQMSSSRLRNAAEGIILAEQGAAIDYIEVVDGRSLTPVRQVVRGCVMAAAIRLGGTRLIDNITFT